MKAYSQSGHSNDKSWPSLREAAHNIGFCVYQVQKPACTDHLEVKSQLEKISDPESDVFYFELNPNWAKNRLTKWAEGKNSKSDDYFILFDIDQNSIRQLKDSTKTSNSFKMFSVFDLRDTLAFRSLAETNSKLTFYISTKRVNGILSNSMWREFMSNRMGRLDSESKISLNGPNALNDYRNFKEAFLAFIYN